MKYSLDASFVINYLKNQRTAVEFIDSLGTEAELILPIIAEAEVKYVNPDIGRFSELKGLKFDREDLQEFLQLLDFLKRNGELISMADIMIASQAIKKDSILVTFDQDFEKVEEYPGFEYKKLSTK